VPGAGTADGSIGAPMAQDQRERFERDGYLVVPGVLTRSEVMCYRTAVEDAYHQARRADRIPVGGALHQLSAAASRPDLTPLVDHPGAFPLVWSVLGWNVHVYHSHLDVHPQAPANRPPRFEWHQDGGRQNRELETCPRPRLSVKLAYWLSDVSQPGRGNFKVVPGSHLTNWIAGPPRRDMAWADPPGAIEVTAKAGDVVFFDRRIWHARSDNYSPLIRKAVFFAYTYRWIATRDAIPADPDSLTPIQRQLLGGAPDGDHAWGHTPDDVPLYRALRETGHLRDDYAPLRP